MADPVVVAVAAQLPDVVTEEQVAQVLEAYRIVTGGAEVGTVVQDPVTGAIAYRVSEGGVHLWSVISADGGHWRDMNPKMPSGWRTIVNTEGNPE